MPRKQLAGTRERRIQWPEHRGLLQRRHNTTQAVQQFHFDRSYGSLCALMYIELALEIRPSPLGSNEYRRVLEIINNTDEAEKYRRPLGHMLADAYEREIDHDIAYLLNTARTENEAEYVHLLRAFKCVLMTKTRSWDFSSAARKHAGMWALHDPVKDSDIYPWTNNNNASYWHRATNQLCHHKLAFVDPGRDNISMNPPPLLEPYVE